MDIKRFCSFLVVVLISITSTCHAGLPSSTKSIAPMLKQVMPSIVSISGIKHVKSYSTNPRDYDVSEHVSSMIGSGVIVDKEQGYIITNSHVVSDLENIMVLLSDQRRYKAELIGLDEESDIALLQIKANNLTEAKFADSDNVEVGDFVVAIGSPYGFNQTVTSGIVSAVGRNDFGMDGYYDFIQTDADINLGNSGGGLINLKGEVIGINTSIITSGSAGKPGGSIGIGFAIPSNMARGIMSQLASHGQVDRGPLGVRAQPITAELAQVFGLKSAEGAIVNEVLPGTPAYSAGIVTGDILLSVDGKTIKDSYHLRTLISLIPTGSKSKIKLIRNGRSETVTILMTNPKDSYTPGEKIFSGLSGSYLRTTHRDVPIKGVRIAEIKNNCPAAQTDLMPGDIIVAANKDRAPIDSVEKLKEVIDPNSDIALLRVVRDQFTFFVTVKKTNI